MSRRDVSLAWSGERRRLASLLAAALLLGWTSGAWWPSLAAASGLYLIWHLVHLRALLRWLRLGAPPARAPDLGGAWEAVVRHIWRIQQRNRLHKDRLRALLARFEQIAVALPDATVVLDADRRIEWANAMAERLLGVRHPHDVGQRIDNLLRHPRFREYLRGRDFEQPLEMPSPVDDRIELSVRLIPFGAGEMLLSARDISTFTRMQAMRRDFVANVSHELRTPLTVLSGYLESLAEDEALAEQYGAVLAALNQQTARMRQIVEDLLELARLESDPQGPSEEFIHVPRLLESLLAEARPLAEDRGYRLSAEIAPEPLLAGSAKELTSVVTNLLHNALRHTPPGTRVVLRWRPTPDGGACLEVEDDGPGIAPEHIPRLTERFYRVDAGRARQSGGSGLGLAIVKHVVQRHDGRLEIDSAPGRGARFRCLFPPRRVRRRPAEAPAAVTKL